MWKEAKAPDGRTYYYNSDTKETRWTKPEESELSGNSSTPAPQHDQAEVDAAWRETSAQDGRTYYYNALTRETKWEAPPAFLRQKEQQQMGSASAAPDFVAGGNRFSGGGYPSHERRNDRRDTRDAGLPQKPSFDGGRGSGPNGSWEPRHEGLGFRGPMPVKTDEPDYPTFELAEEAFFKLLRKHNIAPDTEWEDALRLVIRDREYRAIKEPRDRKLAFEKYCVETRAQEKNKEKERREKLREEFRKMLSTHPEIKHYTRWRTARPMIEREAIFKQAADDDERKQMFGTYLLELKKRHEEDTITRRRTAKADFSQLLQSQVVDPETKWEETKENIIDPAELDLEILNDFDALTIFESHIKVLNNRMNDTVQKEKRMAARRDRQARDDFKQLLQEKVAERKIKPFAKWCDLYPTITSDERFLRAAATRGSTPLDLFRDAVESEESLLRTKNNDVLDVLDEERYEMTVDTTYEEFARLVHAHPRTADLHDDDVSAIFKKLIDKVSRRADDERFEGHRQERRAVDALRTVLKRLDPPIRPSDSYEDVATRLAELPEFKAVGAEGRKQAFEKHSRRLRDREEVYDRERPRRDREHRNGSRRSRERRHRTRSPEVDAYEADRRKAQADRERHYRKPSFGFTPPRERREDRSDDRYRRRGDAQESHYDRERREREVERERSYVSRADPRDRGRALDYGDEDTPTSRPGSIRKRRDSEVSSGSRRDLKRTRHGNSPPAVATTPADDEPQLQSGSEEGEIEEV